MKKINVIPKPIRKWVYLKCREILEHNLGETWCIKYKNNIFEDEIGLWDSNGFCMFTETLLELRNIEKEINGECLGEYFPELKKYETDCIYWFDTAKQRLKATNEILKEHYNL